MKKDPKMMQIAVAIVVIVAVVIGAVIVSGHKSSTTKDGAGASQTANAVATSSVTLQNFAFSPSVITVKAGTTVTWTNKDDVHHTVTADTASADAPKSGQIGKNETYSFTFKKLVHTLITASHIPTCMAQS